MSFGSIAPVFFDGKIEHAVVTVGTSATEIKASATRNKERGALIIYNDSTSTIYLGTSSVTVSGTTKGLPLVPMQSMILPISDIAVYGIASAEGKNIIVMELS